MTLWWHTRIEEWAWHKPQQWTDRSASPWGDASRRPWQADRRNAMRRQCLDNECQRAKAVSSIPRKIRGLWNRLMNLLA